MTKEAILGAIRRGLKRGPLPADQQLALRARLDAHPRHLIPARGQLPRPEQVALFLARVEREFGTTARVAAADDVPGAVADYLAANNLPTDFAIAPHPELEAIDWSQRPLLARRPGRAQASDLVCLTHGYAAVAETGTVMLPASPHRPTTLNLLGDTAIVVLRASRVVGFMEAAWDLFRAENRDTTTGGFMPRNIMWVTGPSRSADIESTLELGAHGPRRLHVILIDDDPAALRTDDPSAPT
jgi:L-lactate dehydrogenase complex protein LldG